MLFSLQLFPSAAMVGLLASLVSSLVPLGAIAAVPGAIAEAESPRAPEPGWSRYDLSIGLEAILPIPAPGEWQNHAEMPEPETPENSALRSIPMSSGSQAPVPPLSSASRGFSSSLPLSGPLSGPYPSLGQRQFDQQLRRYLVYVETLGRPDILIVGSDLARQGINPWVLRQSLGDRGYPGLGVFNWGVENASAQTVEVLLRHILTPEQRPRLVIWADGAGALNGERQDPLFEQLTRSRGYRLRQQGHVPRLSATERHALQAERVLLQHAIAAGDTLPLPDALKQLTPAPQPTHLGSLPGSDSSLRSELSSLRFVNWCRSANGPCGLGSGPGLSTPAKAVGVPPSADSASPSWPLNDRQRRFLAALGFQDNEQHTAAVAALAPPQSAPDDPNDLYHNFSLQGSQHQALYRILQWGQAEGVAIAFLPLPASSLYWDGRRDRHDQAFQTYLAVASHMTSLHLIELQGELSSRAWPQDRFADLSHLNRSGAATLSWQLGQQLEASLLKSLGR